MQISNDVADGMASDDVIVEQVPSFNFVYLALSPGAVGGEALTPKVREAIRLALDYTGLLDATVGGAGRPQASPIPNGFAGTDGLAEPAQDVDDGEGAAGRGRRHRASRSTPPTRRSTCTASTSRRRCRRCRPTSRPSASNCELNPVEISVWADKIGTDGIPVTMLYFAPDHTDSSQYVQYFGMLEGSQWQGWSKADAMPEQADLLSQAFATQDAAARADLYQQLAELMIADQIIIPVVNPNLFLASRADIQGLYYSACCNLILSELGRGSNVTANSARSVPTPSGVGTVVPTCTHRGDAT